MRLPEIRERLHEIADERGIPELHVLADETRRRYNGRRARARHPAPSEEVAESVRAYALAHPAEGEWDIGRRFGLNQGRVSEILHGKRE